MTSTNLALRFPAEDPSPITRTTLLGPAQEVDQLLELRLRRALLAKFGNTPAIDEHLPFLDRRGALYALTYTAAWDGTSLPLFLGVVRHVIATQCEPPLPQPDIEGWLLAGRPADDRRGDVWDALLEARYGGQPPFTPRPRSQEHLAANPDLLEAVEALDQVALTTQTQLLQPYAAVSHYIESTNFQLPPLAADPCDPA